MNRRGLHLCSAIVGLSSVMLASMEAKASPSIAWASNGQAFDNGFFAGVTYTSGAYPEVISAHAVENIAHGATAWDSAPNATTTFTKEPAIPGLSSTDNYDWSNGLASGSPADPLLLNTQVVGNSYELGYSFLSNGTWTNFTSYNHGTEPAAAIDDYGYVIEVHTSVGGGLYYGLGVASGSSLTWLSGATLSSASSGQYHATVGVVTVSKDWDWVLVTATSGSTIVYYSGCLDLLSSTFGCGFTTAHTVPNSGTNAYNASVAAQIAGDGNEYAVGVVAYQVGNTGCPALESQTIALESLPTSLTSTLSLNWGTPSDYDCGYFPSIAFQQVSSSSYDTLGVEVHNGGGNQTYDSALWKHAFTLSY